MKHGVFLVYIRAAGVLPFLASLLFFVLFQVSSAGSNFWLSKWTDDPFLATALTSPNETLNDDYKAKNDYYLIIFGVLGITQSTLA